MVTAELKASREQTRVTAVLASRPISSLPSASTALHTWSPIMDISISRSHVEHFIVGKNDDCRGGAGMLAGLRVRPTSSGSSYCPAVSASGCAAPEIAMSSAAGAVCGDDNRVCKLERRYAAGGLLRNDVESRACHCSNVDGRDEPRQHARPPREQRTSRCLSRDEKHTRNRRGGWWAGASLGW